MRTGIRISALACALACCAAIVAAPASASAPAAALSPANYGVGALCPAPAPGHASCLGLALVARAPLSVPGARALATPGASAAPAAPELGPHRVSPAPGAVPAAETTEPIKGSLTPANLLSGYAAGGAPASAQTIAIVDAYDDPSAEADLAHFSTQFGLASCSEKNGCFRKVNENGAAAPLPAFEGSKAERGWVVEISTDIEVAHGLCQTCRILLVEAASSAFAHLFAAENTAAALGAGEISDSWGGQEPAADSAAFNHPGIVITASAGDNGYENWLGTESEPSYVAYPASSPHVVSVGGTRLLLSPAAKSWESESVWNDGGQSGGVFDGAGAGGGGCSSLFATPPWQVGVADWASVGCGAHRAVADVSADGDPYTGVAVYDSTADPNGNKGWAVIGGTSVSSPIIASMFALAGGSAGVAYPARTLYENALKAPASLHDVTVGSNGQCTKPFNNKTGASGCTVAEQAQSCTAHAICLAGGGYDGPSGVGSPNGLGAFQLQSGPAGAGAGAAGSGAGAGTASPAPPSSTAQPAPVSTPSPAPAPAALAVLSALRLTRSALSALHHRRPRVARVGFAFTVSAATRLAVTLARRVRWHGKGAWRNVAAPVLFAASAGRHSRHLSGQRRLPSGRYRLTLVTIGGARASISFQIR